MFATWAPWIAVVVSFAAMFAQAKRADEPPTDQKLGKSAHMSGGICIALGAVLAILGYVFKDSLPGVQNAGLGALLGMLLGTAAGFVGSRFDPHHRNYAAPISLGVMALALTLLFPAESRMMVQFGAVFGLAGASWILSIAPTHWPATAAIMAGAVGASGWMGGFGYGDKAPLAGIAIGLSIVLLAVISSFAFPQKEGKPDIGFIATALLTVGLGWLIASKLLFMDDVWKLVALGAGAALVISWMVPKSEGNSSLPTAISLVMWLAIATIAFAMRRGFGMSVCLTTATGLLILTGNWRALLTIGPLAALCMYRILKEMHPDAAKAFDIGQHYGLMGLLIGASVLVVALEWRRSVDGRFETGIAGASSAWVLILAMLPAVAAIVIAAKGFVGVVAGVGIGSAIAALKGEDRPHALALQMGAGAALAMEYGWLTEKLDLTRDDKVKSLIGFAIAFALLAGVIVWLSKPKTTLSETS